MVISCITVEGKNRDHYSSDCGKYMQAIIEVLVESQDEYNLLTWFPSYDKRCSVWKEDGNLVMVTCYMDKFPDFSILFNLLGWFKKEMNVKFSNRFYLEFSGDIYKIEGMYLQKYANVIKRLRGTSYVGKDYAVLDRTSDSVKTDKRYSADAIIRRTAEIIEEKKKRTEARRTARPRLSDESLVYDTYSKISKNTLILPNKVRDSISSPNIQNCYWCTDRTQAYLTLKNMQTGEECRVRRDVLYQEMNYRVLRIGSSQLGAISILNVFVTMRKYKSNYEGSTIRVVDYNIFESTLSSLKEKAIKEGKYRI